MEAKNKIATHSFFKIMLTMPTIFWALLVLLFILAIVSPNSVRPVHLLDFTRQAAGLILVSIGQTIVMLIGGLDLSVGAVITLTDVVAAQLMMNEPNRVFGVIILCLLIGSCIGLINGLLIAKFKMPAFVVTLGMSTLILGITLIYSGGAPKGAIPSNLRFWGTGFIKEIPAAAVVWVIVSIVIIIVISYFPIGRYIYSTGANEKCVHLTGIDEVKIKIICYVASGFLASVSGLILAAYIGTGSLTLGSDYQLNSIAAAVLGGTSFEGGRGSIFGTIVASLFMIVMFSLIAALKMEAADRYIIQGLIILIGLLLNGMRKS